MKTFLKVSFSTALTMSPFAVAGALSYALGWNDMQQMGAILMACIFSPMLFGVVMAIFPVER